MPWPKAIPIRWPPSRGADRFKSFNCRASADSPTRGAITPGYPPPRQVDGKQHPAHDCGSVRLQGICPAEGPREGLDFMEFRELVSAPALNAGAPQDLLR